MTNSFENNNVRSINIVDVVAWTSSGGMSRLFLPPIQRSVVWKNEQIVNYWDSLLRGYPAGLMMVHRPNQRVARTTDGNTCGIRPEDFELFDGQQRMTAILLGHRAGQLNTRIKLWVDLGVTPSPDSGQLFQLRVSSTGQPFGYEAQFPNKKPSLSKRRDKIAEWVKSNNLSCFESLKAFEAVEGKDLIESGHAVPLHQIISLLLTQGRAQTIDELVRHYPDPDIPMERIKSLVDALDGALKIPIIFQLIDQKVVEDEKEYIRFFGRLGQGGTPLSQDELTYSIIKHQYPEVHDRLKEIMDGPAGRISSEVNLVLAALRVAKVLSPWDGAAEWEIVCRPYPGFVSRLKQLPGIETEFQKLIPSTQGGRLKELLESIRCQLVYDKDKNPSGLPVMLLARLPHQLVDVLILMATQQDQSYSYVPDRNTLVPFVLHWLLFVGDNEKAANLAFKRYRESGDIVSQSAIQVLIQDFEKGEIARIIPNKGQIAQAREEVEKGGHLLRSGPERFAILDADVERKSGDALRFLSANNELIKRALMWLQREYLTDSFRNFDPTSSRDEDLPIDLDHLVPHKKFGIDWRSQRSNLAFDDTEENFRWRRHSIGNSLGNHRWLDAAENRSRGAREIKVVEGDFVQDPVPWNRLIEATRWSTNDAEAFQKLIDLRTLDVYEKLLVYGELKSIVSDANSKH